MALRRFRRRRRSDGGVLQHAQSRHDLDARGGSVYFSLGDLLSAQLAVPAGADGDAVGHRRLRSRGTDEARLPRQDHPLAGHGLPGGLLPPPGPEAALPHQLRRRPRVLDGRSEPPLRGVRHAGLHREPAHRHEARPRLCLHEGVVVVISQERQRRPARRPRAVPPDDRVDVLLRRLRLQAPRPHLKRSREPPDGDPVRGQPHRQGLHLPLRRRLRTPLLRRRPPALRRLRGPRRSPLRLRPRHLLRRPLPAPRDDLHLQGHRRQLARNRRTHAPPGTQGPASRRLFFFDDDEVVVPPLAAAAPPSETATYEPGAAGRRRVRGPLGPVDGPAAAGVERRGAVPPGGEPPDPRGNLRRVRRGHHPVRLRDPLLYGVPPRPPLRLREQLRRAPLRRLEALPERPPTRPGQGRGHRHLADRPRLPVGPRHRHQRRPHHLHRRGLRRPHRLRAPPPLHALRVRPPRHQGPPPRLRRRPGPTGRRHADQAPGLPRLPHHPRRPRRRKGLRRRPPRRREAARRPTPSPRQSPSHPRLAARPAGTHYTVAGQSKSKASTALGCSVSQ
mmetsp:Transcript_277/g.1018  ORF Transcript_277/g.1018 Transcript_277/m.1018 type:complete len:560 (-) Transcript_277:600-2279(-)